MFLSPDGSRQRMNFKFNQVQPQYIRNTSPIKLIAQNYNFQRAQAYPDNDSRIRYEQKTLPSYLPHQHIQVKEYFQEEFKKYDPMKGSVKEDDKDMQHTIQNQSNEIARLKQQLADAQSHNKALHALQQNLQDANKMIKDKNSQLVQLQNQVLKLSSILDKQGEEIHSKNAHIQQLSDALNRANLHQAQSQRESDNSETRLIKQLTHKIETLTQENDQLQNNNKILNYEYNKIKDQLETVQNELYGFEKQSCNQRFDSEFESSALNEKDLEKLQRLAMQGQ